MRAITPSSPLPLSAIQDAAAPFLPITLARFSIPPIIAWPGLLASWGRLPPMQTHSGLEKPSLPRRRKPRRAGSRRLPAQERPAEAVPAAYSSYSFKSGAGMSCASVSSCTSSTVQPGATSRKTRPSGVGCITARSVTIRDTHPLPVMG